MAQIIPIRDLKNTSEISEKCRAANEPIFVTKNGYGDMVVMSMEVYTRSMAQLDLYKNLKEAEDELNSGAPTISAREFLTELRTKHEKLLR